MSENKMRAVGETMNDAARRLVDNLSRRRFVAWLGVGGAALAAGLGLNTVRSAYATGTFCNTIRRRIPFIRGDRLVGVIACVLPGQCGTASGIAFGEEANANKICARFFDAECADANDCPPPHKCEARVESIDNLRVTCEEIGTPGKRGCPAGLVLCQCVLRVRGGPRGDGELVCRCQCN